MPKRLRHHDPRPLEQIREHYEVERELADRLRTADDSSRRGLYTDVYDELYERVPHHRKLMKKLTGDAQKADVERQIRWLRSSLGPDKTFLEVGAGDCLLTFEVAKLVKKAIAVEVSETMTAGMETPGNFELAITDGVSIPVPPESVDVVYSMQLMEHLHPDDAFQQLENIYRCLKPGGIYFCATPNRITGPHDISRHFDSVATCLHLKEYTSGELARLFRKVGFRDNTLVVNTTNNPRTVPVWPFAVVETLLGPLPRSLRLALAVVIRPRFVYSFRLRGVK